MAFTRGSDIPYNVDPEQQGGISQDDRLYALVTRFSSRPTRNQIALNIPPFVFELSYGIYYLNQCPIQPLINVFLIVQGCSIFAYALVLLLAFLTATHIIRSSTCSPIARFLLRASRIGEHIFFLFSFAWVVAGQVWVFGALANGFQSSNSTETATYCQPVLFWTAFTVIIIFTAIPVIIVTIVIFVTLIGVFGGRNLNKRYKNEQEAAMIDSVRY